MKRSILTILALGLFCAAGQALTWSEAREMAVRQSSELQSAAKQLESSDWSYKRSFSPLLPQLSASAGLSEGAAASGGGSVKTYSYGLSASQTIFSGLSNYYGVQSAAVNLEYQKASSQASQATYYYELRSAFLSVLIGQENIQLLEKILKQRQDNVKLIQLRYDSGKEDKGNLLSTKADAATAAYDLAAAKRELGLAKLKLAQLLQQPVDSVEETAKITEPAAADMGRLLSVMPAYAMAQYQLKSAELALQETVSGFLPSVSLSGSYRRSGSDWPPDSSSKSWSLNVSYALFPGGTNLIDRAIYSAKLDQAKADFTVASQEAAYSLQSAYNGLQDAVAQYQVNQLSLNASEQRSAISQVKYLNGLTTYDEWNRIESTYIQAQKSLLNGRKQALLAEALWHKTYGGYVK